MRDFSGLLVKYAGWEDSPPAMPHSNQRPVTITPVGGQTAPRPVRQPAAQPARPPVRMGPMAAPARPRPGDPVVIPERVKAFFNHIQLPTKRRFGGVPGQDYNDYRYRPNFWENADIRYSSNPDGGITLPWGTIKVNMDEHGNLDEYTLVHELQHFLSRDVVPLAGSGRSEAENRVLSAAYPFEKADMDPYIFGTKFWGNRIEKGTTNAEYKYRVFRKLWDELGREPTYKEFTDHVRGMDARDLSLLYQDAPNDYASSLVERIGIPAYTADVNPYAKGARNLLNAYGERVKRWLYPRGNPEGGRSRLDMLKAFRKSLLEVARNNRRRTGPGTGVAQAIV